MSPLLSLAITCTLVLYVVAMVLGLVRLMHGPIFQLARMRTLGLQPVILPPLRDVDTIDDARAVALEAPESRFAATLADFSSVAA